MTPPAYSRSGRHRSSQHNTVARLGRTARVLPDDEEIPIWRDGDLRETGTIANQRTGISISSADQQVGDANWRTRVAPLSMDRNTYSVEVI